MENVKEKLCSMSCWNVLGFPVGTSLDVHERCPESKCYEESLKVPPQLAMVAALLPLPFLAMMIPVPESPTFLLAKNRFLSYSYLLLMIVI